MTNLENIVERILASAEVSPTNANQVLVHRHLIGQLREAYESPDEPSRKPCPMDGQAIDTSRAENECTCTLAATTAEHAVHDAITRALTEAGVKQEVLVGMCIEVGLEAYRDAVNRRTGP